MIEVQLSSRLKGESVLDTVATLEAMHVDAFVLRDADATVPDLVATHVSPHVSVLSGGAGSVTGRATEEKGQRRSTAAAERAAGWLESCTSASASPSTTSGAWAARSTMP